jgi:RimJ/RimL family protein N-acetyltransferase
MSDNIENEEIIKHKQNQMLKLATKNFYNELVKFGIDKSDIVTVSLHLLDYLMKKNGDIQNDNGYYNRDLTIKKILDVWNDHQRLEYEDVSISLVHQNYIPKIVSWLKNPTIKNSFISRFPENDEDLIDYFRQSNRKYFVIQYNKNAIGLIGADNMDEDSSKLEMRKFIGEISFHGKGIGKRATLLFLHYVFHIMKFNKVYIYSGDTNIRNINLNSKFGFELEGIFFEDIIQGKNKKDVVRMGLLKSQWYNIFSK